MSNPSDLPAPDPRLKPHTGGRWSTLLVLVATVLVPAYSQGQAFTWTREQMLKYTAQNPYERFPDGRPKVPDSILEKVRGLSAEEVLGIAGRGYPNQFVDGMQVLHPGKKLVGRALTLQLIGRKIGRRDPLVSEGMSLDSNSTSSASWRGAP